MIDELEKAAKTFNYIEFGWRDFDKVAGISANVVKREFDGWKKALSALKKSLNQKGMNLSLRPFAPNSIHSDKEMFEEMDRIWHKFGHRPSRNEWESSEPKISYNIYKQRFDGWQNACLKFIEHKMGGDILVDDFVIVTPEVHIGNKIEYKKENSRNVSPGLKVKILYRDNFRCVLCGKSPSTDFGTKLDIDHIVPFSKGGKSTLENLQTLCKDCNLGKSDTLL